MKILISPAKSLDLNSDFGNFECSIPKFLNKASEINEVLKANFTVSNLFNSKHTEIIGGPPMGRVAILRFTTTF